MMSGRWSRIAPEESSTPLQTMSYWCAVISSGSCCSSAASPPRGIENGLWLKSIWPVSSLRSYIGKSVIQQNSKQSLAVRPSSSPILSRAALANWLNARDRPGPLAIAEEDVGQARLALVLGPGIHPVAKGSVAAARRRDRPHPHIRVAGDHAGENAEPRAAERLGRVPDRDRVAQIGL